MYCLGESIVRGECVRVREVVRFIEDVCIIMVYYLFMNLYF